MFTVEEIERVHEDVKSGADFPKYIQQIRQMGVVAFETWVDDSHTVYFGANNYKVASLPQYEKLVVDDFCDSQQFAHYLKIHQQGETNYFTFCSHCAETGIEKWFVCLEEMTCTYYDKRGEKIVIEQIPQ